MSHNAPFNVGLDNINLAGNRKYPSSVLVDGVEPNLEEAKFTGFLVRVSHANGIMRMGIHFGDTGVANLRVILTTDIWYECFQDVSGNFIEFQLNSAGAGGTADLILHGTRLHSSMRAGPPRIPA